MPKYSDFVGAIFDVDDTLLDNETHSPKHGRHERSRVLAAHTLGKRLGIKELETLTLQEARQDWLDAEVHSLEGVLWTTLVRMGLAVGEAIDHNNRLLKELVGIKDELQLKLVREEGQEVPGASSFVRALASQGFKGKLAIVSTASRREIDIFLEKTGLSGLFPSRRIISKESVTHMKPHPELFEKAFDSLGLSQNQKAKVLAFEDHPRGIVAAHSAGLYVCAITTGEDRQALEAMDNPPDLVADSYKEFADLLAFEVDW